MAGHSKWAQIKHKKAITDAKKGARFSKMMQEVQVAAATGGIDPSANPRLRTALSNARAEGITKDTIERALSRAAGRDETQLEEFLYEATAPGGIMILIEGITDSKNRTHAEIKHLLSEHSARLADPGSVLWNFQKIGIIEFGITAAIGKSDEEIELGAIDAGAVDIKKISDRWVIETVFEKSDAVCKNLEVFGIRECTTTHEYKNKSPIEAPEANEQTLEPLFDELLEHNDVQEIYTNITNN